jgi:hypothetical protein
VSKTAPGEITSLPLCSVARQEPTMRTGTAIALAVLLVVIVLAAGIQLVLVR